MTAAVTDLWPSDINLKVLPPIAVLKAQEGLLAQHTQGMLHAKLNTVETEKLVQHELDLIAPGLNFYRQRLLSATHDRDMLFPVTVTAEAFAPKPLAPEFFPTSTVGAFIKHETDIRRRAATDEEFIHLVRQVLQSEHVRSLIHSLIARINAKTAEPLGNGPQISQDRLAPDEKEAG